MNTKLYSHKTDGGAEYLCTAPIEGTNEGDLFTAIIRLDGEPEFLSTTHAAAPELLNELEHCLMIMDGRLLDVEQQIERTRAAIAKAKGK